MKILLFGKDGQVGWELQRALAPLGELIALGKQQADFENIDQIRQLVRQVQPDVMVNTAAYTAVDKAQSEPDKTQRINAEAVGMLASKACRTSTAAAPSLGCNCRRIGRQRGDGIGGRSQTTL